MRKQDNPAAQLARKRWDKLTPEQRSAAGRKSAEARWGSATDEQRRAQGAAMRQARTRKRQADAQRIADAGIVP